MNKWSIKGFPFYKQLDQMDCGPACVRMIAKHYGKDISLETLRKLSKKNREGVSLYGIAEAAESIGLKSIACKLSFTQLVDEAPTPCIIHWKQKHFVVVTPKVSHKKIVIADPAEGIISIDGNEFKEMWIGPQEKNTGKGMALLLEPTSVFYEIADEKANNLNWLLLSKYLLQYKAQITQLIFALLLGSLLQLIFPFLTQSIVDTGINSHNINFIQLILIAQFFLVFSQTVIEFIRGRILLFVSTHINLSILADFWMKLMKLPLDFFDTKQTGDILQRIMDHRRIESFITTGSLQTLFSVFNLTIFSAILFIYSITIFWIFLVGSSLYLLWIMFFLKYRRRIDYKHFSLSAEESSMTMQLIYGMQEIKLNNAERLQRWKWEEIQARLFKLNFNMLSLGQFQLTGAFFINQGKNILITYLVAKSVIDGHLTLGAMLSIQYIISQLNNPIEQMIGFVQQAQDAKISLERLNEIHSLEDEESSKVMFNNHLPDNSNIYLENISFTYPGAGNKPVLKNITLTVPSGKVTAIVGLSGSGKTTLLKLVQKFYNEFNGDIKVGENNLKYISPNFWRGITGSVMQDGFIFSDTLEKNIAVGDEVPNYSKLVNACKIANIQGFVEALPLGFNTKIGMEGNGISAGQKQRILIARAVYKNPQFLFFDEATNALDANNERVIIENLQTFFEGRTVIVVAHRLSTVKDADKIVLLHDGEIAEEGTHEELTFQKGKYYELVKNQLELGS